MAVADVAGVGPSGSMWIRTRPAAGMRANMSMSGSSERNGARILSASSSLPSTAPSMTTSRRPRNSSGMSGISGTFSRRNAVVTSSGAVTLHSAHPRRTFSAWLWSHTSMPA